LVRGWVLLQFWRWSLVFRGFEVCVEGGRIKVRGCVASWGFGGYGCWYRNWVLKYSCMACAIVSNTENSTLAVNNNCTFGNKMK